jgi:hypothetical protein
MIVYNGSIGLINNQVASGFAGGSWQGGGITSSAAAAASNHLTALGVFQNGVYGGPNDQSLYGGSTGALATSFDGVSTVSNDVLVKYTYYGDTDLSGVVDGSDYSRIDNTIQSNQNGNTLTGWYNGDFNYDGVIDGSDYTLIDNAFNNQGAGISATLASSTAQIAGTSAVPEPTTLALAGVAALGLLKRRPRTIKKV